MNCQRCNSTRVLTINARHKDMLVETFQGQEYQGYAMSFCGPQGSDHTELEVCLECGQTQGTFPIQHFSERPQED
jgi:hypothetical protein